MPARDIYHNTVRTALEKSGWQWYTLDVQM